MIGFGTHCAGGYLHGPAAAPISPGISGQFGQFGQFGQAGTIATITTTLLQVGLTAYQLDLARRAAKSAEHAIERQDAEAAAAAAAAAANRQAQIDIQTANLLAAGGQPPTGGGVMNQLSGVPVWAWAAGGGVLLLGAMMMRGRR